MVAPLTFSQNSMKSVGLFPCALLIASTPNAHADGARTNALSFGGALGGQVLVGAVASYPGHPADGVPGGYVTPTDSVDGGGGAWLDAGERISRFYVGGYLGGSIFPQPADTKRIDTIAFGLQCGRYLQLVAPSRSADRPVALYAAGLLGFRYYSIVEVSPTQAGGAFWAVEPGAEAGVALHVSPRLMVLAPLLRVSVPIVFTRFNLDGGGGPVDPHLHLLFWVGAEVRFEFPLETSPGSSTVAPASSD